MTATERDFLAESRHASGRAQRRLRMVLAGVALLFVLAVCAGIVALDQRGAARAEATAAAAQRLGAQALADEDVDRALLLARQGVALDDSLQTRSNLLAALLKSPAAIGVIQGDGRLTSLALSPDDRTLAFMTSDSTLTLVDTATSRRLAETQIIPGHLTGPGFFFDDLQFSPDGRRLAIGGTQPAVLDVRTRRVVVRMHTPSFVYGLAFSPDGRTLFAAADGGQPGSTIIQRYDARSGRWIGTHRHVTRSGARVSLMVTGDGRRVVTSFEGGETVIRDARTLRPLRRIAVAAAAAALSSDDRTMLVGGADGSVRFLDLVTGEVRTASGRHDRAVFRASFSADGRRAATAGDDNRIIVWDVARAAALDTFEGHSAQIAGLAISRDARTLYTAGREGKILIWDVVGDRRFNRSFDVGPDDTIHRPDLATLPYDLSPDGRVLAAGHRNGTVALIDRGTLRARSTFRAVPRGPVRIVRFLPGGRLLVVGGNDGYLAVVDPSDGTVVEQLRGHSGALLASSISADGRVMATSAFQDTVLLWTLKSGKPVGRPRMYSTTLGDDDVSLSPDGRMLAIASPLGVDIIDVATLRRREQLPGMNAVLARFSPDGRSLVVGNFEGEIRVWSTASWRPVGRPLAAHTTRVGWASFSPDSRTLATGSTDGTISLVDLPTQRPLGEPLRGVPNRAIAPAFTPDGAQLFGVTDAGRGFRWDVRPSSWSRLACAVAGRRLTRDEWRDALPDRDYAPAC